ncbi:preprotein translocase subunit SecG [Brevundimonas sp.]|uniref:preprotein translocase subunit SecG n=1 Tax=Brevundimonas sp. TaxID=1871086 RepID=UPI0028A11FD3|nr:preprotein translocase subunit SecG [Brevundimonas sp.]
MLQTILLVAMILISVALTAVILLQRSEGGALGMGGGPSGFMTARGAGNLLTRATSILAIAFFVCAISLTIAGNFARGSRSVIDADAVGAIAVGNEQPAASTDQPASTPAAPAAPSLDDLEASLPAASAPAPAPAPAQ